MTDELIIAAMERLGVGPHDFVRAQSTPETLSQFQRMLKQRYRSLVREVHPDCGGTAEEFQALTAVLEDVQRMEPRRGSFRTRRFKWAVSIRMETV